MEPNPDRGEQPRAHAMTHAIADPDRQLGVLRRLVGHPDFAGRATVLAQVLRLSRWHTPVHELVEHFPDALAAIVTELEDIAEASTHS